MISDLATTSESTQPRKPSVKWDLSSNFESVPKETTAPGMDFRRERLDSQPALGRRIYPQTYFLRPHLTTQKLLLSVMNSTDAIVKKLLPKSHLSRVIIRDNLNAQRIYEMELAAYGAQGGNGTLTQLLELMGGHDSIVRDKLLIGIRGFVHTGFYLNDFLVPLTL
ncbi:hypothetical protein STEG23_023778 [Scotinomys teguina]